MSRPASALIARMRYRLAAKAWLLVVLVLSKAAFASVCPMDIMNATATASSNMTLAAGESVESEAVPLEVNDGSTDWGAHAGGGDCHCACAHASPLSTAVYTVDAPSLAATDFPPLAHSPLLALRDDQLRPPIA